MNKHWQVDVRGGLVGIYFAEALASGCESHWPEPCLRLDGDRVIDPDTGRMVGWKMPDGLVPFAARVALALETAGVALPLPAQGTEEGAGRE